MLEASKSLAFAVNAGARHAERDLIDEGRRRQRERVARVLRAWLEEARPLFDRFPADADGVHRWSPMAARQNGTVHMLRGLVGKLDRAMGETLAASVVEERRMAFLGGVAGTAEVAEVLGAEPREPVELVRVGGLLVEVFREESHFANCPRSGPGAESPAHPGACEPGEGGADASAGASGAEAPDATSTTSSSPTTSRIDSDDPLERAAAHLEAAGVSESDANYAVQSIQGYTGGDYIAVNDCLVRKCDDEGLTDQAKAIDDYLKHSPKFDGSTPVYRGFALPADQVEKLADGGVITWPAYSSTSPDEEKAQQFAITASSGDDQVTGVLMVVGKHRSGVSVDNISEFKGESEVLFPRDARFRVSRVERVPGENQVRVYVEEAA